jgi:hypothetical protein
MGWHAMAADAHGGWPEERDRLAQKATEYRGRVAELIGLTR